MNTKNLPLIIGIALPIIFILIISVIIFTPSLSIKPSHNFIYTTENQYYYGYDQGYKNMYKIENGRVALEPLPVRPTPYVYKGDMPTLYIYDVRTDSSHQISFSEAQSLSLDPGPSSPDGYTVSYQYGHDGIFELFGSNNDNNGYFVSKGNGKKKLSGLTSDIYRNQGNFKFIGWIK